MKGPEMKIEFTKLAVAAALVASCAGASFAVNAQTPPPVPSNPALPQTAPGSAITPVPPLNQTAPNSVPQQNTPISASTRTSVGNTTMGGNLNSTQSNSNGSTKAKSCNGLQSTAYTTCMASSSQ